MRRKTLVVICSVFSLFPLFPQTPSFDDVVQDFAEAVSPNLPFAASMGLNWSTPYIGPLIGYPLHFGVGVFGGSVFMDNAKTAALGAMLGITIEDSLIKGKQWLPGYVIAARMGGFDSIPFDIGVKFGYLPDVALWGPLNYNSRIVGLDIHYALHFPRDGGPAVALGIGFDRFDGGVTGSVATVPSGVPNVTVDMPVHIMWESNTIKLQTFLSQNILTTNLYLFGNFDIGYTMNKAGVKFGDLGSVVETNMVDVSALSLLASFGFGCELNVFRIDASLMWNLMNFETGISFGFRYQR
jgi:hypothetical protein